MTDWIRGPSTLVAADEPLSSYVTKDLMRGNLLTALEQSGYRYQSLVPKSAYFQHDMVAAMVWESTTDEFGSMKIPIRRSHTDGDPRSLYISMDGLVLTAGRKAKVRIFRAPKWTDFVELEFDAVTWTTKSGTITITELDPRGGSPCYRPADAPSTEYEVIDLYIHVYFDNPAVGEYLRYRAPYVKELP